MRARRAGEAALHLARELGRRRRFASAERVLQRTGRILPFDPELVSARARLLEWRLGNLQEARDIVAQTLVRLEPHDRRRGDLGYRLARLERRLEQAPHRSAQRRPGSVVPRQRPRAPATDRLFVELPDLSQPVITGIAG